MTSDLGKLFPAKTGKMMELDADQVWRVAPDDPALADVLTLMQAAFAAHDGLIDPPSSINRLRLSDLQARHVSVLAVGRPPRAAVLLTRRSDHLAIGKLSVAADARRSGLARRLLDRAAADARAMGLAQLRLQTRVELTDNHRAFRAMGFRKIAETAHPGYDRPTSLTFVKDLT